MTVRAGGTCALLGLLVALAGLVFASPERGAETEAEPEPLAPLAPLATRPNPDRAALGRLLFFDRRLSGDATLSCATCHDPARAYADGLALSAGYPGSLYFRNTPTLLNAARGRYFFWDARMPGSDLPTVVRDHISEAHFMNADGRVVIERLRQVPGYERAFASAFGGEPTYGRILDAVADYVRTLESRDVPLDRYLAGDRNALSANQVRGLDLFRGRAGCARCHGGPLLSDGNLHALCLPPNDGIVRTPERHITFRRFLRMLGVAEFERMREDPGRYALTKDPADRGRFRTPSLREVARTAPYMHDGSLATLAQVVAFHAEGAGERSELDPVELSERDRADLVAFLESLSGAPVGETTPAELAYELRAVPERVGQPLAPSPGPGERSGEPPAVRPRPLAAIPQVPVPDDNPLAPAKVELGRLLFFDERLSGDLSTSCASCHDPRFGWGDGNMLSRGYPGTQHWRNSQTVVNSAYFGRLFWAGESTSLEAQANSAITGNLAGNGDPEMIEERLAQVPEYVRLFHEAFGVRRPSYPHVLLAIASFERAVPVSSDSPFDRHVRGEAGAMSEGALRGMALFQGKAGCIQCHDGPLFMDESFHATGVPPNDLFQSDPLRQIAHRFQHTARGVPEDVYRTSDRDMGLYYVTKEPAHVGLFRTPPLRYLRYTAPYMHNGVFGSLEEVVDFYDRGGGEGPNRSPLLRPLGLTDDEKWDLVEFLESLSGSEVRVDPPELPPYVATGE